MLAAAPACALNDPVCTFNLYPVLRFYSERILGMPAAKLTLSTFFLLIFFSVIFARKPTTHRHCSKITGCNNRQQCYLLSGLSVGRLYFLVGLELQGQFLCSGQTSLTVLDLDFW